MKKKSEKKLGKRTTSLTKKKFLSSKINTEFDLLRKSIHEYFEETVVKIKKASDNDNNI
jgi:hypothetical protein